MENLGGSLTSNYHASGVNWGSGAIPGSWCGAWHTFTLYRRSSSADIYWDGAKVTSYQTSDAGVRQDLILNIGNGEGNPVVTGPAGALKVDWVRAWEPA